MKKIILISFLIFPIIVTAQTHNYTFSELKGMEDNQGNTNLFFRQYYFEGNSVNNAFDNSIYHWDLSTNIDTVFLYAGGYSNPITSSSQNIFDYEFWDKNPSKYIYLGIGCTMDCSGYVQRFDDSAVQSWIFFFPGNKIEISKQNDSLLYSSSQFLVKSTDGGKNWFVIDSAFQNYRLVSISPFNYKEVFVINNNVNLIKTEDGCKTFTVGDTSNISLYPSPTFKYDKDKLHIYRIRIPSYFDGDSNIQEFYVSNNKGDLNNWTKKYSSSNNLYLSIDDSVSGTLYLADGNKIFKSTDYGNTFNVYKTLDSSIVGIYKKPASDLLYAATKYDIYEITPSSIKSIKHLTVEVKKSKNSLPSEYILYQNYPNPFNPTTTIKYQIPKSGLVQLKVYDILGREAAKLVNEIQKAGEHSVEFDAGNLRLASRIYFYQLKSGGFVQSRKMVILK